MLTFEITKTNTPLPQKGLALFRGVHPTHTYAAQAMISSVKQSKTNVTPCLHRTRAVTSLDLYASVMHCQSLPGVPTRHKDIDVFIIRENTEGKYSSMEHENVPGVVESLKIITCVNSLRISEYAFNLAREKGSRKVTAVHKANIMIVFSVLHMKLGDGLFLRCCKEVAAGYPEITFDNMIVDNTTMQLVSKPQHNVCAGLDYAVFETVRKNRACTGYNIANPTATLLASFICFHMSLYLLSLQLQTVDLGGQGTASEVVHSIMLEIQRGGPRTSEQI
uniref:Isocitrate dehydrogenase (NAD(+)) 3 non-catalytic subunit gamma n=1 Tax=Sinocyclocheilus grahami TaxID=75366 RepID=A0A672LHG0_SINGR